MSQQINLANPQLLKPRYAFGLREMLIGAGVGLAAMLAWAGYLAHETDELEQQAVAIEARQAEAQQNVDTLTARAGRGASPLLTERIREVQSHIGQREVLLSAINTTLEQTSTGFSGRMTALARSTVDGVWLTGFTLASDRVELEGAVLNAGLLTTYIDRLGRQAPFSGTSFSGLTASEARSADTTGAATYVPAHLDFTLHSGDVRPGATP